jgi:protein gp37
VGEDTAIEWCDSSWGAWWGCAKVSLACNNCYAETWAKRTGFPDLWGVDAGRRTFGVKHWTDPLKWNAVAGKSGKRHLVFCNSMADVFDNHSGVTDARKRLWYLIQSTPYLTWILLTKRIGNAKAMLPTDWGDGYPNVWLGISVCNQVEADRDIPKLLTVPAQVRFLSCEPLLGRIDLFRFQKGMCTECAGSGEVDNWPTQNEVDEGARAAEPLAERCYECGGTGLWEGNPGLSWVIAGGESGAGARYMDLFWAENLLSECRAQEIPFFMKQLSAADTKDIKAIPEALRVRQWPKP